MVDIPTLQGWIPTIVAGGALALLWNDIRNAKAQFAFKIDEVVNSLKKALFREDGITNYMPRLTCEREQGRCQQNTLAKIEAMSVKMDLMDTKREHAKELQTAQMGDVKQALAVLSERVEQLSADVSTYMTYKRKEIKSVQDKSCIDEKS
jgi:hypothetical protein